MFLRLFENEKFQTCWILRISSTAWFTENLRHFNIIVGLFSTNSLAHIHYSEIIMRLTQQRLLHSSRQKFSNEHHITKKGVGADKNEPFSTLNSFSPASMPDFTGRCEHQSPFPRIPENSWSATRQDESRHWGPGRSLQGDRNLNWAVLLGAVDSEEKKRQNLTAQLDCLK